MSTQEQIEDEILAKRLQDIEYQQHRRPTQPNQARSDEEYARQLAEQPPDRFALQTGQTAMVRLHHPLTARQIGEVMYAHFVTQNVMCFELVNNRGKFLRATSSGTVEFTSTNDDKTKFYVENVPNMGTLYLMNKNYAHKQNVSGLPGWYLSMSNDGKLSSNGAKTDFAQWALIAANTAAPGGVQQPAPAPLSRASSQSVAQQPTAFAPVPQGDGDMELRPMTSTDNPLLGALHPQAERGAVVSSTSVVNSNGTATLTQQYGAPAPRNTAPVVVAFPGHDAGRDALLKYFATPSGLQFLQQPVYRDAYRLHNAGTISKILHRPDWAVVASRFQDYTKLPYPALDTPLADSAGSFQDKKMFFELGYTVVRSVVPPELVANALRLSSYWVGKHRDGHHTTDTVRYAGPNRLELIGAVSADPDILRLFYATALVHLVSQLIGEGDVAHVHSAKVLTLPPGLDLPVEFSSTGNPTFSTSLPGDRWVIDGFDGTGAHSPYNVLIAVALTDTLLPNEGNFCVFPGSQMVLMESYKQQTVLRSGLFSEDPLLVRKPDLGEPTQLLLKAGDAVLCTQRMAYHFAPNTSSGVRTMAFFRVAHVDHEVLKGPALDGLWLEFRGSDKYMNDEHLAPITAHSSSSATESSNSSNANTTQSSAASNTLLEEMMSLSVPPTVSATNNGNGSASSGPTFDPFADAPPTANPVSNNTGVNVIGADSSVPVATAVAVPSASQTNNAHPTATAVAASDQQYVHVSYPVV